MQVLPITVLLGLTLTPLLISVGQVLFKISSRTAEGGNVAGIVSLVFNPYLLVALIIYAGGTIIWVFVLKHVPLTQAYPFMALTFCAVPVLAWLLLGEALSIRYGLGVAMIIAGLLVVNA